MSAVSAGYADNESDPLEDNDTFVGRSSRPPKTTDSAHRPSNPKAFVVAAKNKTWQPSDGILFSHVKAVTGNAAPTICGKHSQHFSTTARQCSQLKSTSPKAPLIRPYIPAPRPYTPTLQTTDKLFMSDEDGNDGFDEDEEDLGELLAQSELSDEGFNKHPTLGTKSIRKPQQLSKTEAMHRNPPSPKTSINLILPPRKSLDGILLVKKPKAKQPPKTKDALIGVKKAPPYSPPTLLNPYGPRRPTQKEIESSISQDYLLSPEITRLAQLPRPVEWHVSVTEVDDEQLDEPMLNVLCDLESRLRQSHSGIQRTVTWIAGAITGSEAEFSYKFLMIRPRLLDMSDSIAFSYHDILKDFHDVRWMTRIRCGIEARLQPGPDDLYDKEIATASLQRYLATEIVEKCVSSQRIFIAAYNDLEKFYSRRHMRLLYDQHSRSIQVLLSRFIEIHVYKDSLVKRKFNPGRCCKLAQLTNQSLRGLVIGCGSWRSARTDLSRAEGLKRETHLLRVDQAFFASSNNLQDALWDFTAFEIWRTARGRRLIPNIRTECKGSARSHSPFEHALAKQAVDTGQEVVRKPVMIRLEEKRLRRQPKDQIQTVSVQNRCYSSQDLQVTPEASEPPSGFHGDVCTPRAHIDIIQRKQVTAAVVERQPTRDIPHIPHIDDVSPLKELPQSKVSAAAKRPSSYSPKGFAMSRSECGSTTNDSSTIQLGSWSYALYTGPNNEKVKLHYCKNKVDTERIAQLFRDEEVIGFDIEWKANAQAKDGIKQNVSLIQLASEERVALFHMARYRDDESPEGLVTPTLKAIMESPHVTKVGVAIKGDCTRLHRFLGIKSQGLFELSHLYKLVKYSGGDTSSINKRLVSLATQVEEHLGLPLSKGEARTSDWSLALNLTQVQYAASDSYAGFQLFHKMEHQRKRLIPIPPRPYHAELNLPIRLTSGKSIETDDEPEDLIDEVSMNSQPSSVEELARDFLKIKLTCPAPTTKLPKRVPRPSPQPCKPEVIIANEWVAKWHSTLPPGYKSAAGPACLRAHALWHEQGFTVPEAAALLRDPPLLNATVATYVLDALRAEKLPFEKKRLAALLLHVPQAIKGRYKTFFKKAGIDVR